MLRKCGKDYEVRVFDLAEQVYLISYDSDGSFTECFDGIYQLIVDIRKNSLRSWMESDKKSLRIGFNAG